MGFGQFLLIDLDPLQFPSWFFHFAFASTASTIVSGALAERCEFYAYLSYCATITGMKFPLAARLNESVFLLHPTLHNGTYTFFVWRQ